VKGPSFSDLYPIAHLSEAVDRASRSRKIASRCQVVFLSLPNGLACQMAPRVVGERMQVLDLSADYRFTDLTCSLVWHRASDQTMAATAVYGLPELYRDRIAESQLIGCPVAIHR